MTTAPPLIAIASNWLQHPAVAYPLAGAYLFMLVMVCIYGLHRYWLVISYLRARGRITRAQQRFDKLPCVTIQLPMFNEGLVAERIIDASCNIDYPRNLFQVQVLDDSTDECAGIARARCEHWEKLGVDIQYLHRDDRSGFKAGALANGMATAKGDYIAIFDADFIPPADFLKRSIHVFTDRCIGMAQAKWEHLNRDDTVLTRSQAVFLDGHFVIEHDARQRCGRFINFNGTAGIWRREAIEAAGGWQHDTLTEDVDLSYRAQLLGWRFVYLPWLGCPAELPPETNAFKSQQHRWAKGSIQTAIKLLPDLLRAKVPLGVKMEAFFHLTGPMVYVYVTLIVLMLYPVMLINLRPGANNAAAGVLLTLVLLLTGTVSAAVFYITSQRAQKRNGWRALLQIPSLMGIGVAIAFNNARGCVEALVGHESPFVRTPKYNTTRASIDEQTADRFKLTSVLPTPSIKLYVAVLELLMGAYMIFCLSQVVQNRLAWGSIPFLIMFAWGYFYVGFTSLRSHLLVRRSSQPILVQPS